MPVTPRSVAVTFWLPEKLKRGVKRLAKLTGKLEKTLYAEAVRLYLESEELKGLTKKET